VIALIALIAGIAGIALKHGGDLDDRR